MGHRANLILLENQKIKIHTSRWEGQKSSNILSQGLKFCENHFLNFLEVDSLMDNAQAEGGILIDKDKNYILFFETELLASGKARELFIDYLEQNIWVGWKIEWALEGNVNIAEYLNLMEDRILADNSEPKFNKLESLTELLIDDGDEEYACQSLITIIHKNQTKEYLIYGFYEEINKCIAEGEDLRKKLPSELKVHDIKIINELEIEDVLLVDYDKKNIYVFWTDDVDSRHIKEVMKIWKNWHCERQTQGVQFNFEYTNRDKDYHPTTNLEFQEYLKKWKILEY